MQENSKSVFVVDASFMLAFLLRDSNSLKADTYFKEYRSDKIVFVAPALLYYEVANGLKSACLTKRIDQKQCTRLLSLFLALDIKTQVVDWDSILKVAFTKKISCYDASYVVLTRSLKAKLLTFDKQLKSH
ncbi:hypothetical protein COY87_03740 [Candidatus Roizmanbacteria bacterium CG_4_10_14_0_8_um_filter_33_9]|uniref:PIN domain-containing protein n=1 Tax=Candidatus Roizmanbacteria bacterium CG_4_10_14_0_8_um_filter_33_9 TaxID=1974826 RepID=A0A2M7QIX5_9BACT|nr:MAG: hypothetical protein COY87_03740 [Candidatus Roizmanbacteria bacterium CG_4_10_14_0_8_um_filter_33_9]